MDIREHLFPMLVDKRNASHDLYGLVMQDDTLSMEMRKKLTENYETDGEERMEYFFADLLVYGSDLVS